MNIVQYSKHTLTLVFLLLLYLAYLLVKPLLLTIITAILLAYLFFPIYTFLHTRIIKNSYISSFLVLILILLIVTIPAVFILHSLTEEGLSAYNSVKMYVSDPTLFDCSVTAHVLCTTYTSFFDESDRTVFQTFLQDAVVSVGKSVWTKVYTLFIELPSRFIDFIIMIFLLFFLFVDGKGVLENIRHLLPMKLEHETYILKTLKETTDAIVFGQTVTAVLQGVIAGVGFWIFGVPHPLLLGVIVGFLAIIPFIGATVVFVPIALSFILLGLNTGDNMVLIKGILLVVYGLLFISSIDTFLKPKIIGDKAKLHPAFVFVGVIGGLSLFGIIGFFLGPIIFGLFLSMIHIYKKEKKQQLRVGGKK
jgi:predicted PurR-regulated permease PerM